MPPAIETTALTKRFGDVLAVDALDLTVERGEVYGFLGPNGAGKSTTINLLLGFTDPSDGGGEVLGHDAVTESRPLRQRIGVLPESFTVYDRLTAREHVTYAGQLSDADPDPEVLLDRVGLDRDAWDRRASGFSTGMGQRLALACALVGDPDLLILDEPSSGLDPGGMAEMRDLITAEAESGTTVFFSSHILSEVEAVCDRIGIIVDGSLAAEGTVDDLRDGSAVHATVELDVTDAAPDLADPVRALPGVESAGFADGTVSATVSEPAAKMAVIRLVDDEATVEDVVAEDASLEAVFERYTNDDAESEPDPGSDAATDGDGSDGTGPAGGGDGDDAAQPVGEVA
jgi:ABC-2 type transport system ATP-binding protein